MGGKWKSRPDGAVPDSERQRALRARKIEAGTTKCLFDQGEFIAVDGEGFSEGAWVKFSIGNREYRTRPHYYALLSASDGSEIYAPSGRLRTKQCLDYLLRLKQDNPQGIFVCFGASYDFTQILTDLKRDAVDVLLHGDGSLANNRWIDVTYGDHDYRIEMRPRKQLSVWRWTKGALKHKWVQTKKGEDKLVMTDCDKVTLWDAWGFFQGSFVKAMQDWLPGDKDAEFVIAMKQQRGEFERSEIDTIRHYNQIELRCLVDMMNLLRGSLQEIGARISRWDGAGAIASALLRKNAVHDCMAEPPSDVRRAALHAYAGGHIEAYKLGRTDETIHHYDLNSAYPAECVDLPDLACGEWQSGGDVSMGVIDDVPEGFTIVRCSWRFHPGQPFYPLYYRERNGAILYPERGHGWYWLPEFRAAQEYAKRLGAIEFNIHEYHHFQPASDRKPFAWVPEIYAERQRIIEAARKAGTVDGRQIAIRLGLNALYGKLAQQVGARQLKGVWKLPRYFQLEWAGWITAGTRASLMLAAIQQPKHIVSIATDGIYSTAPLDLYCPAKKELGAWEYQTHQGMTIAMPGVYWLGPTAKAGPSHFSRGWKKEAMREDAFLIKAWRDQKYSIEVPTERMVTLGQALASKEFWKCRGQFVDSNRRLRTDGDSSKRAPVALTQNKPHKGLVATQPMDMREDYTTPLRGLMSAAYPVIWLRGGKDERLPVDPDSEGAEAAALS
jgi:hypothetical protein